MADIIGLQVRKTSVYKNGKVVQFDDGSGDKLLLRQPITYTRSPNDRAYTVKKGDRIDRIAYAHYKNTAGIYAGRYWWIIADVNQINNPLDLSELVGVELIIPDLYNIELRSR